MIDNPGIYTISEHDYHSDPCPEPSLSNSIAKVIENQSAKHAWLQHPKLNPEFEPRTSSMFDEGSVAHALLLENDETKIAVLDFDSFRTKASQEARDEAYSNGIVPILARKYSPIKKMVDVAKNYIAHSELKGIFDNGKPEQTLIWQEENGIWCRSRLDWLTDDRKIIIDYKTTTSARPEDFASKHIKQQGYYLQASFYSRGVNILSGTKPIFVFLVQENVAPYSCSLIQLADEWYDIGNYVVESAIETWGKCLESGKFPSYKTRSVYAYPPNWLYYEHSERVESDNKRKS